MISHRITKYHPSKRNPDGSYSDHTEWTSISDIGDPKCNDFTYEEYEKIEDGYVNAIMLALKEKGINKLTIEDLELYNNKTDFDNFNNEGRLRNLEIDFNSDIRTISDGAELNVEEIEKVTRLILRETIWMNLGSKNLKVKFGYDYYMYITCDPLSKETIKDIESKGLFVEPDADQRTITVVDSDGNKI